MKNYKKFKEGIEVRVAECYLSDEASEHINTSPIATVFAEPSDDEQLVGIQYEGGEIDYVPQDILEVFKGFTRTISLPVFGIEIIIKTDEQHKPITGVISSTDLKTEHNDEEDELYNAAMDGIESLVLAHAMAEVNVMSPSYIEGLKTAVNACTNNF